MKIKFFIICFVTYLFVNGGSFAKERGSQMNSYTGILNDKTSGLNVYGGVFDFSDDRQRASLIGIEHQNHNLYRDTLIGKISPVTGFFISSKATLPRILSDKLTIIFPPSIISVISKLSFVFF